MMKVLAVYGSPRRKGNTAILLTRAVEGARQAGADRCQSLWVKKHWIDQIPMGAGTFKRKGLFISVGATKGKKLFDGVLLTMRYFFEVLDMELWNSLLYRGMDFQGDVLNHPEYLEEAYEAGKDLVAAIQLKEESV